MTDDLTEFHAELRAVARDLLGRAERGGPESEPVALDLAVLAGAGWLGLEVPISCDGAGGGLAEVAVVLHEMGRAAARSPYFGAAVMGVGTLCSLEPSPARDGLLRTVANGQTVAVGVATDNGPAAPFRLEHDGGRVRLIGSAPFVPDAPGADRLLVLAADPVSGVVVVEVEPSLAGVQVVEQRVVDLTRRLGRIDADGAEVSVESVHRFEGDPEASARRIVDRGALGIAYDSLGAAEAMMEATVAYASVREQFGRPIGSFQAVQHACADMLVQVTLSRELVELAVRALGDDDPGAGRAVSMAKSHVCAVAVDIVGKAMQLHGGIGYTWDSGVHTYLKRVVLNRSLFGSPTAHRRRLAAHYAAGLAGPAGD